MPDDPRPLQEEWFPTDFGWNSGTWDPVAGDNEARELRDAFVEKSRENGWTAQTYTLFRPVHVKLRKDGTEMKVSMNIYGCYVRSRSQA